MSCKACTACGVTLAALLAITPACAPPPADSAAEVRELESPAAPGSSQPDLAAVDGRLYLTWLQQIEGAATELRLAEREGGQWTPPRTIAADAAMLVNWADFPSIAVGSSRRLAVQWLVRHPESDFGYGAYSAVSADGGQSWGDTVRVHDDDSPAEHGFVSLVDEGADGFGLIWLDGRAMESEGKMSLRYRRLGPRGPGPERVLDEDVCTCCQTSALMWQDELWVVYRDHGAGEIRDISVVHGRKESWSDPVTVHEDGWEIAGCPVNGPALAAAGDSAALAWFTAAQASPRVLVAFPDRRGEFDGPFRVDEGNPVGRVDVTLLDDGAAVVSWIERREKDASVLVRRVGVDGSSGPARTVGLAESGRPSGFPRLARIDSTLYVAWTAPGPPSRLRLAALSLE